MKGKLNLHKQKNKFCSNEILSLPHFKLDKQRFLSFLCFFCGWHSNHQTISNPDLSSCCFPNYNIFLVLTFRSLPFEVKKTRHSYMRRNKKENLNKQNFYSANTNTIGSSLLFNKCRSNKILNPWKRWINIINKLNN
jgi:hypothetical protein